MVLQRDRRIPGAVIQATAAHSVDDCGGQSVREDDCGHKSVRHNPSDQCGKFDELMASLQVQICALVELRVWVNESMILLHCVSVNTSKNAKAEGK